MGIGDLGASNNTRGNPGVDGDLSNMQMNNSSGVRERALGDEALVLNGTPLPAECSGGRRIGNSTVAVSRDGKTYAEVLQSGEIKISGIPPWGEVKTESGETVWIYGSPSTWSPMRQDQYYLGITW